MSNALTELQAVIFAALSNSAELTAIVSTRIHDEMPSRVAYPFVSFGAADHRRRDADDVTLSNESFQVDGWSQSKAGKVEAKDMAAAIENALHDLHLTAPAMGDFALTSMTVQRVRIIRARDQKTYQAAVQIQAVVERCA